MLPPPSQDPRAHWAPGLHAQEGLQLADLQALLGISATQQLLRSVPGRETFFWPPVNPGWIIKRFAGKPTGERWYKRLASKDRRSPAQIEFENLAELSDPKWRAMGLRVPQPLVFYEHGPRSLVVMARVPHSQTLREALTEKEGLWPCFRGDLLRLVLALHGLHAGERRHHRDLYLQHILLSEPAGELCLIDLGRVRAAPRLRRRWLEKDLAALLHSCPAGVGELERLAWLALYLRRLGGELPRAQARRRLWRWARAIESRRTRMQSHTPKFGESREPRD